VEIVVASPFSQRIKSRWWLLAACLGLAASVLAAAPPARAGAMPSGFEDTAVAQIGQPMDIDWTPDGRALVPTKPGQIRVIQNDTLVSTPALDLSGVVCTAIEQGLGGLAVHPEFASNHYIYIYYTYAKFGPCGSVEPVNRLSRFVLPPSNVIDPSSEVVLMDTPQVSTGGHHNGGDIEFGPDGYVYVTIGDGNKSRWAADLGRLQGKIVRLTDDGDIPPGNSFEGAGTARCNIDGIPPLGSPPGTKCQEIYATGLRNPFRLARDPSSPTTRFFINDVGLDYWEEIDELTESGHDFGWPAREGPCEYFSETSCTPPPGLTDPLHWYNHNGIGGAVTGGAFVPKGLWPAEYDGKYLFADYVFGKIYQLDPGGPECRLCIPPTSAFNQTVFSDTPRVVEMAFGPYQGTQALYYVSREDNEVRRIVYAGSSNRSPNAVATATPPYGPLPLTVTFDGSGSSDPDADTLTYQWDFKDGSPIVTGATPVHTFTTAGAYAVELTVDDGHGATHTTTMRIDAGNLPPVPDITTPSADHRFSVGETLTLTGSASDPEDGPLTDVDLSWEVRQHHHTHFHPYLDPTVGNNLTVVAPEPEDFNSTDDSYIEVLLTATDSSGLSTTVSRVVEPRRVNLTFNTVPAGLDVVVEGQTFTAPQTVVGWTGWQIDVEAPDQLDLSGVQRNWTSWSDGGTQTHEITVPGGPATYTATFDTGPGVRVTPGVGVVAEVNAGSVVVDVPVRLNRTSATPVTIDWATVDTGAPGIATADLDYEVGSGTVTFAPGETSKMVSVTVLGDTIDEPPLLYGEWVLLQFSNPSSNAALDASFYGLGIAVILDDDPPPLVRPGAVGVVEGDSGSTVWNLPVTLSSPSGFPVTVDWSTVDAAGSGLAASGGDFVAGSGTLTFQPSETVQYIPLEILGDTVDEPPLLWGEWGLVSFSNPANATLDTSGFFGLGLFVILDDDG
jgi:glucose/arabinose dehydrogenase/PKD repeat protein